VRREANGTHGEWLQVWRQRRRALSAARAAARVWGEDTPFELKSSGGDDEEEDEDEEEGEVTPPLHSPPPENLPSLSDLFSRQTGFSIGTRQPKRPRVETGPLTGLSPHSSSHWW
jgi:hypothetical protein